MRLVMDENRVIGYLDKQINITKRKFSELFNELEEKSKNNPLEYLIGHTIDNRRDPALIRRINYTYKKYIESIKYLKISIVDDKSLIKQSPNKLGIKELEEIGAIFQKEYTDFCEGQPVPSISGKIIRRVKGDLEFSPLSITDLDSELFSLCYAITNNKTDLEPNEQQIILNRIRNEFLEYINNQRDYHDLSTLWWALCILIYQDSSISDDKKNGNCSA